MNGYYIPVKNTLLEDKHLDNMGDALWLYLWFLDKMTSSDGKVLYGKPVKLSDVQKSFPSLSKRRYLRMLEVLRSNDYVTSLRTPHGLCIKVNKAKKIFGKRSTNSATSEVTQAQPQMSPNGTSNNNKTVLQDNTNKTLGSDDPMLEHGLILAHSTKAKPKSRNPEVQTVVNQFEALYSLKLKRPAQQRKAAYNLIRRYETPNVVGAIKAAYAVQTEKYAPQILNLEDLWDKWDKLAAYYVKKREDQKTRVAIID